MSETETGGGTIGRSIRRIEDPHLLIGQGRYAGDVSPTDSLHMAVVRSHLAHARVVQVDVSAARSAPGVVAAWTADEVGPSAAVVDEFIPLRVPGNRRPLLAGDRVRYVGEPVAAVFAVSAAAATDAAALVSVDLDPLPVVDLRAGSDQLIDEAVPGNVVAAGRVESGDVERAFAAAAAVVAFEVELPRVCGAAMEPRTVTAVPRGDGVRVATSTQAVFSVRRAIARALELEVDRVEVVAEDVGGGFGPKAAVYPEDVLVPLAALRLGRAATWTATRSEDFASTFQSHGVAIQMELAADADGRILGVRGSIVQEAGAYPSMGLIQPPTIAAHLLSMYRVPAVSVAHRTLLTNRVPTAAVRGGSRPVGNYVIERLVDRLALATGIDRLAIRERNLVAPDAMPWATGLTVSGVSHVYDSGDFPRLLKTAGDRIDYPLRAAGDGLLHGVAVVCGAETTGFGFEPARLRIAADGRAVVAIGSTPQGQGHRTLAAQVLAERLGWPLELIDVIVADTTAVGEALVTGGSRSAMYVGNAAAIAGREGRRRLAKLAADQLEADAADIVLDPRAAAAWVRGVPSRRVSFGELLRDEGLVVEEVFRPAGSGVAWASSCHAARVSVDPGTGRVEIERYVIAHDCGRLVNPVTVRGQLLGGLVHGIGYALHEEALYDSDGQLVTGSFLDYSTATAPEVPLVIELIDCASQTDQNPEGFKGVGESASVMAPAAIAGAVEDALRQLDPGARVARLPLTPDRVFELLRGGERARVGTDGRT
jgi:aerobic carbon-monoxide dehydrogenase large subunit